MGRVSGRREEEFTEWVVARRRYLRRFAYLLCGEWHQAEDLVQTALTKLYLAWPRVRRSGTENAYARQVVLRSYLDERRRPWRRESAAEVPDRAQVEGLSYEEVDQLHAAVRGLPGSQRAAVVLRYWCGLSIEETATDLGITVGTVKSHTARAVERLRQNLADDRNEERTP